MEIQYLKKLKDYPSMYERTCEPISLEEIAQLEQLYNNGNPFPKVLKEYLYLAGNFCTVIDSGISDTQQEFQEYMRELLLENDKVYTRPFYALETYSNDWFIFIYLDEGDNPNLYLAYFMDEAAEPEEPLRKMSHTLPSLINNRIQRYKEGGNPF